MQRIHFDSIDSTSDEAMRLLSRKQRGPLLITAAQQTAGRGRGGRTWSSPRGGVWMSLLWPASEPLERYEPVPLLAGWAVVTALEQTAEKPLGELRIKWPNDVLVDGGKVAGVLCQCEAQPAGAALIVGVGINVNFDPALLPGDLRVPAAVVRADNSRLIAAWSEAFAQQMGVLESTGFAQAQRDAIRSRLAYVGQRVQWQGPGGACEGVLRDLDDRGGLVLETAAGAMSLQSGEVRHIRTV